MSSTTEAGRTRGQQCPRGPRGPRGQVLALFALSLLAIMAIAALAFDSGMVLLQLRDQQNASDAAALAGARFLPDDPTAARAAALDIAAANGFVDTVDAATVVVNIPPASGPNAGQDGFVEVLIGSTRPSIFAVFVGIVDWDVGARAVAANHTGNRGPFALLALDPSGCEALKVEGSGELISNGDIQVNSVGAPPTCPNGAFRVAGESEVITAPGVGCNVVGDFSAGGGASYTCSPNEGIVPIPDPFDGIDLPQIPTTGDPPEIVYPTAPLQEGGTAMAIPSGCPDGDPATPANDASPALCWFTGAYAGTTWRLYPGYYPGGINLEAGTFYLEPGIYHVADGGFRLAGETASVTSVDACTAPPPCPTTLGGGVLIFNSTHPSPTTDPGPIILQGGNAGINLLPLVQGTVWDYMVIFQDPAVTLDVSIVGGSSTMQVRGTIYAPTAKVVAEGSGGAIVTDQIIAYRFQMRGDIGSLTVAFDENFIPEVAFAGLVE